MYRPQFAYETPSGCRDEEFVYYFDSSNTPQLAVDISGNRIDNIPLVLEQDAPFYWRGVKVDFISGSGGPGPMAPQLFCKFQDPYQNDLSDGLVPATHAFFAQNPVNFNTADYTGPCVLHEPEIYCPRGGVILFFVQAPILANPAFPFVSLFGVKRFQECSK